MTGFPDKKVIAELTAKMLIEVEAVRFMSDKPFIFTSGWASPVYTDCRRLISFPRVRRTLIDFGVATVEGDRITSIEEKPPAPRSDLAVGWAFRWDGGAV